MSKKDLSSFIEEVAGDSHLRVQESLGDGYVRLRAKEAQRRQAKQDITCVEDVVLELLRNSRDAGAHAIFVASWREGEARHLTVLDDGCGIPAHLHETIFEPFVTSKLDTFHEDRWGVHGRGMALFSIKENVDTAQVCYSAPDAGTALAIEVLQTNLSEKVDQSTLPYIHVSESGEKIMRGPRNIARIVMEFALDSKGNVEIYLGSPTEIAATLAQYSSSIDHSKDRAQFETPTSTMPSETVSNYLSFIFDPEIFAELSGEIGLPISARSARRIIDGQIKPLEPFINQLTFEQKNGKRITNKEVEPKNLRNGNSEVSSESETSNLYRDQRKLKLSDEDLERFQNAIIAAFEDLAEHYYLDLAEDPTIKTASNKISISIPFDIQH